MTKKKWIPETLLEPLGVRTLYRAGHVLHASQSEHQSVEVFKHEFLGTMLIIDGVVQLTERDTPAYAEMMCHVPIFAHGNARKILIVGGGDCSIAMEALRHQLVQQVTLVEIDDTVVKLAKEYFPAYAKVFEDFRFQCVIADGMQYVAETAELFDVIIVDSSDPLGPNEVLFSDEFYAGCKRCLRNGGVLVTMSGTPFVHPETLVRCVKSFEKLFRYSGCYLTVVPTYVGGHLAIGWASGIDIKDVPERVLYGRHITEGFTPVYWTPEVQTAGFALPKFIITLIEGA